MNPGYPLVSHRAAHRCEYCHAPEAIFNLPFEVEHIIPLSREGTDVESNLALACRSCNLYKGNHVDAFDELTKSVVRLFDPRQNRWEEHFSLETESGALAGLTAIGRATVECLRMNSPAQREARLQWLLAGLSLY